MHKLTYLLINTAVGKQIAPLAVVGRHKTYGHAEFDPAHNAHVYRFTKEEWEGGIGHDITENKHRWYGKWVVIAEVAPDPESDIGKLELALDALRAENDALKKLLAKAGESVEALAAAGNDAARMEYEAGRELFMDGVALPEGATVAVRTGYQAAQQEALKADQDDEEDPDRAEFKGKTFRAIRKELIEAGGKADDIKTSEGLIDAILALRATA